MFNPIGQLGAASFAQVLPVVLSWVEPASIAAVFQIQLSVNDGENTHSFKFQDSATIRDLKVKLYERRQKAKQDGGTDDDSAVKTAQESLLVKVSRVKVFSRPSRWTANDCVHCPFDHPRYSGGRTVCCRCCCAGIWRENNRLLFPALPQPVLPRRRGRRRRRKKKRSPSPPPPPPHSRRTQHVQQTHSTQAHTWGEGRTRRTLP